MQIASCIRVPGTTNYDLIVRGQDVETTIRLPRAELRKVVLVLAQEHIAAANQQLKADITAWANTLN